MASKQQNSKPFQKNTDFGQRKNQDKNQPQKAAKHQDKNKSQSETKHQDKNKSQNETKHQDKNRSQKEQYRKKNFSSSPALSSSAMNKVVLLQCEASSKPSRYVDPDSSGNNTTKSVKDKFPINVQPHYNKVNKYDKSSPISKVQQNNSVSGLGGTTPFVKNVKQNFNSSQLVSPHFMAMASQSQQSNSGAIQKYHPRKFQNDHQKISLNKPGNTNSQFQYKYTGPNKTSTTPKENFKNSAFHQNMNSQNPRNNKQFDRCINTRMNVVSNHIAPSLYNQIFSQVKPLINQQVQFSNTFVPNSNVQNVKKNFTPQIKFRKRKPNTRNPNLDPGKKNKSHSRSKNNIINDFKMKEPCDTNVASLLSIQCVNASTEKSSDLIEFSDEDDNGSLISETSFDNMPNLIDFSHNISEVPQPVVDSSSNLIDLLDDIPATNDTNTSRSQILPNDEVDFDSSDESEESDVISEVSVDSSILSTDSRLNIFNSAMTKEAFVSVFWDIENCSLPSSKSAIEFANFVRNTFYEGRTEVQFTAACDVSHLSSVIVRELDEAAITLIHISSVNKNAADKKIQALLQKFQLQYRKSNSAVVLISSDSDFSQFLVDMRFQHHIYVNLICKSNTRDSLITAANKCIFLDDVLKKLPDRDTKNDMQHILLITNLPQMKFKQIKNSLSEKLSSFNCRITVDASCAKIVFKDHSVCLKAINSLKGYYLGGNALNVVYKKEMKEIVQRKKAKKTENNLQAFNKSVKEVSTSELTSDFQIEKDLNINNGASLSIIVSTYLGNVEYWKKEFENSWNTADFLINWEGSILDGFLLVKFKSLKKAQKVRKILMKNQMNNQDAPKFFKLIKYGEDLDILKEHFHSIEDVNKKKIDEFVLIIENKKIKLVRKHENMMNEQKNQITSKMYGEREAIIDKLKEYEEQMETFKSYSDSAIIIAKTLYNSENIDSKLKDLLCDFTRECNCFSSALPIYAKKNTILTRIRNQQVIIIKAETGSGKSTQLAQYLWREQSSYSNGKVICTQPRKIAAISLAKYVSFQTGNKLGDVVGYQVGMSSSKVSPNTKILYVTDFTMLKMLVSENLNYVSYIIIDEAHERTIYTDILLGMIKHSLSKYPHLKIVITSATIDTSIFQKYFALSDSSVLHISGRTFPIQDIWLGNDVTPGWDYFTCSIDKAFELLTEEPGDILSFLTTPLETEKAFEVFSRRLIEKKCENKVKTYHLHGKMNSEEQQKVFEKTANGIRKVVFATNCAETSITISGVKYVIDCGLVKESHYDPIRNMNVLSVGFVSKSSAEQRRGRAGRTQVGKCYRLYSKNNYDKMISNTDPEILRINLGQALMKLMKMGINNPLQFDFLQSPPAEQLNSAMNQLIYLKAVDEITFSLTDLGNKMAVLPLEPRLCHLIFQGFDNNVGYDSLVVASLVTMSHTIFFRNSENKDQADIKKRRFCESESDYTSYLEVYKEWVDIPKNLKSQWCVINCINARAMRTVQELVSEIILILQKELLMKVPLKFHSQSPYDTLQRIIFYSFSQNLAVFSGHPKFGYRCLNITDRLLIHPSSSLYSFEKLTPQFVVYDTILKTSQTYMMNICPVTKDMILEAVNTCSLAIDIEGLENMTGLELNISNLGEKLIVNNFIGKKGLKRKELQAKIKELIDSDFLEIDIDVPKGNIKIFSFDNKLEEILKIIFPIINDAKQVLLCEERNLNLFEERPFTAVLGAGGIIQDVVLPGEFKDLKIILKEEGNIESIVEKLSLCGNITGIREWKKYFKISFQTATSAKKALDTYSNENDFSLQSIDKCLSVNEKDYLYKVHMSFYRRPCAGIAYISVDQPIPPFLLPSSVTYNDVLARISLSKKTGDIRIVDLPLNTDKNILQSVASSMLPPNIKITKCIVSRKKPFESTDEEMGMIKKSISNLFAEFTFKENIEVYLKKPVAKDIVWNATVFVKNSLDGETAVNILKSRKNVPNFLGGFVLKPQLQTYLYCKFEIFSVVKEEIKEATEFFKTTQACGNELNIDAKSKWSNIVETKITSNNVCDITDARKFIHRILSGDTLNFNESSNKEKVFSNFGNEFMNKLAEEYQDCFILQNSYSKTITIFGKESSINNIKMRINEFLIQLENDNYKEISLKTESGKSILKELLKTFGYDLQKLREECLLVDVKFNKYKQILTVQGNSVSIQKCESLIQDLKTTIETDDSEANGEMCPVCYDEVSENRHRLEYCGHLYCTECLLHLIQNTEDIPLKCVAKFRTNDCEEPKDCEEPIVIMDIFWAINGRKPLQKVLFEKFLYSFVEKQNDISFCPSPNCSMIFRVTKESNIFKCPVCGNSICTRCEVLFHYGMSCSLYKCTESDSDHSLKVWIQENPDNRKLCPSCIAPIEKNGGCNHMTCWKCKCHMCWICLKVFPTPDEVYTHQSVCPMRRM